MQFVYPEFLYSLFLLAIPIVIHLFNFKRYKTIYFPDVRFLSEIKEKSRSSSRLKHLLVLFSRLFLITSLILAFAQPYWKSEGDLKLEAKNSVQFYVDNSFSMLANGKNGLLIEQAKQRVLNILKAYKGSDQFQLVTNDFNDNPDRWFNKQQLIEKLQTVKTSDQFKKLSEVMNRLDEAEVPEKTSLNRYLISDFQKSNFDLNSIDSSYTLQFILVEGPENQNLSVEKVSFTKPFHLEEQNEELNIKVVKYGRQESAKVPLKVFLNGKLKSPITIEFGKEDSLNSIINFQSEKREFQKGLVSIKDYPITFDDSLFFAYEIRKKLPILHLFGKDVNQNIRLLFSEDSLFEYSSSAIDQINYSLLDQSALLILDEIKDISSGSKDAFKKFVDQGGSLMIIPSEETETQALNVLLRELRIGQLLDLQEESTELDQLNKEAAIFKDVFESFPEKIDLPKTEKYWLFKANGQAFKEELISLKNRQAFLSKFEYGKGKVYLFNSPINESVSNFSRHALFVPTLYNIALYAQKRKSLFFILNEEDMVIPDIEPKESPVHLIGNSLDLIPSQEYSNGDLIIRIKDLSLKAGHYSLVRDEETLSVIGLNYSRAESDYELFGQSELEELLAQKGIQSKIFNQEKEGLTNSVRESRKGIPLWKYFIILALLFLGTEIALLRLLK